MKKIYDFPFKKLNKQNPIIKIIIVILIIVFILYFSFYIGNESFRDFIDTNILKKNINDENSTTINFEDDVSSQVFSYDKYIAILNKNSFTAYNSSGNKAFDININLSNPISYSNNRFICLAENNGKKIYLIDGQNIAWQNDLEGNISKICVNKNGYVSVIISGTSYKSIIITFDPNGKELFKTYLSNSLATDISISNDNKYLALAEIDYTGSNIQSNIKILSFEKSQNDPTNAVDYIYPASSNSIINTIKYNSKNRLICLYDNSIHMIQNNSDVELSSISEKNDLFVDINLDDCYLKISEDSDGLFVGNTAHIMSISSDKESLYNIKGTPKNIYCSNDIIAINLGSQINFINNSGWLQKTFYTSQEAKDIKMASGIAGIIYKNKIEIINL